MKKDSKLKQLINPKGIKLKGLKDRGESTFVKDRYFVPKDRIVGTAIDLNRWNEHQLEKLYKDMMFNMATLFSAKKVDIYTFDSMITFFSKRDLSGFKDVFTLTECKDAALDVYGLCYKEFGDNPFYADQRKLVETRDENGKKVFIVAKGMKNETLVMDERRLSLRMLPKSFVPSLPEGERRNNYSDNIFHSVMVISLVVAVFMFILSLMGILNG